MKYCNQCGTQLNDNAKYCSSCGNRVELSVDNSVCRNCGEPVKIEESFCPNCGEPNCIKEESYNSEIVNPDPTSQVPTSSGGGGLRFFGVIMMVLGGTSLSYGFNLNNSFEAQLNSFFSGGTANPGTIWIIFGSMMVLLGLVFLLAGFKDI